MNDAVGVDRGEPLGDACCEDARFVKPVPAAFVTSEFDFSTLADLPDRLAGVDVGTEER